MRDNSINQLKNLAKIYAGIDVQNYNDEVLHWESVWNWVESVMQSSDNRFQQIQNQIAEIWLIPGSTCEIVEEF